MKARVTYKGDVFSESKDFPDDLAVGTEIEWTIASGTRRRPIKTYVVAIHPFSSTTGVTHHVEIDLNRPGTQTRMTVATVPDGPHLTTTDIMQMVMLVNSAILNGSADASTLALQKRLNALIPVVLRDGINPSAIEIYKDI